MLSLSKSADGIDEIDAVCLLIKATQNRLSDRQQYVFNAVQSLFGRDIAENIVLLFTHSDGMHPTDALRAVKEAEIKCAVNDKNQPVFFLFDNCQSDAADEQYETIQEQSWKLSFRGMEGLFKFLDTLKSKSLRMTQDVLQQQKQLEVKICNLQSRVQMMEIKQNELKQTQEALEESIYEIKTKKEKRIFEDLKKKYHGKIGDVLLVKKLEKELQESEKEKIKLLNEVFDHVETADDHTQC